MKITLITLVILHFVNTSEWQIVSISGPEPRYINQLIYANNRLILFGGKNNSSKGFDDLWEWKNSKWNLLGKGVTKRWDHSYCYMGNYDQIFLFGGRTFEEIKSKEVRVDLNDNWIYKNGEWDKLEITNPNPRSSHCLVFNQNEQQVILFGGRNKDEIYGDTWSFDGKKWNKLDVSGPTGRYGHTLTYDPDSQAIYLFGGFDGEKLLNDFWAFKGEKWIEFETKEKPSPRMGHAMQFDNNGNAILFGGWEDSNSVSGELWFWMHNEWNISNMEQIPQARLSCSIGYDRSNNEFILFGGSTGFNGQFLRETWKLSLTKNKLH